MFRIDAYLLLRPNWKRGVKFRRGWRTNIQTAITGRNEKRSTLRSNVRRGISYAPRIPTSTEANYLKRKLFKHLPGVWGIPIWQDETLLTSDAAIGVATLQVDDTRYKDFENNGYIIMLDVDDPTLYHEAQIISFTNTTIVITPAPTVLWDKATTEIFPVLRSRIASGQEIGFLTDSVAQTTIDAEEAFFTTSTTSSTTTSTTTSSTSTSSSTSTTTTSSSTSSSTSTSSTTSSSSSTSSTASTTSSTSSTASTTSTMSSTSSSSSTSSTASSTSTMSSTSSTSSTASSTSSTTSSTSSTSSSTTSTMPPCSTVFEEGVTPNATEALGADANFYYGGLAQWDPGANVDVCKIKLMLSLAAGDISGKTYYAEIWTVTGAGAGLAMGVQQGVTSNGVAGDNSWNYTDVEFVFPTPISLNNGTKYAVLVYTDYPSVTDYPYFWRTSDDQIADAHIVVFKQDGSVRVWDVLSRDCVIKMYI